MRKVSIVIPIYNISKYLSKCLESVIHQTYGTLEIILVDDGSSDESGTICDEYAAKDSRIKVIHKENGGLVSARKTGIQRATGKYLLHVDGDDYIEHDMVEKLMLCMEETDADFVQCGYLEEGDTTKKVLFPEFSEWLTESGKVEIISQWMKGIPSVGNQIFTKLFKTELMKECYSKVADNMSLGEDCIVFFHYVNVSTKISSLNETLYHYRIREESLSHSKDRVRFLMKENILTNELMRLCNELFLGIPQEIIDEWVLNRCVSRLDAALDPTKGRHVLKYVFEDIKRLKNKRVVIYGAGQVGRDYIMQLSQYSEINIVAWVDKNHQKYNYDFRRVEAVDSLENREYDFVLVAVKNEAAAQEIKKSLGEMGVCEDKILFCNR